LAKKSVPYGTGQKWFQWAVWTGLGSEPVGSVDFTGSGSAFVTLRYTMKNETKLATIYLISMLSPPFMGKDNGLFVMFNVARSSGEARASEASFSKNPRKWSILEAIYIFKKTCRKAD
jgi:hypothetical protein